MIFQIDISQLDFNTPLFGPVSSTKSEPKTASSTSSADQNDTGNKLSGQKRKIKDEDEDYKEEKSDDSDSGSGSGSGSNNSRYVQRALVFRTVFVP